MKSQRKDERLYNQGTLAMMDGRLEEAIDLLARAAKRSRDRALQAQAWGNLGVAFRRSARLADAKNAFEQALEVNPNDTGARFNLGNTLRDLGEYQQAVEAYQKVREAEPRRADVANNQGVALMALNRMADAEKSFQQAVDLDPDFASAWSNLGSAQTALGRKAAPIRSFQEARRLAPERPGTSIKLGHLLIERGHVDAAVSAFNEALQRAPGNLEAITGLAQVMHRQGENDEAMALLQPLIQEDKVTVNIAIIYAQICRRNGRSADATRLLERMLAEEHGVHEKSLLNYSLGDTLDKCGETERAFAAYTRANDLRGLAFSGKHVNAFIDHTIHTYTNFDALTHSNQETDTPVFIVGMPRSGTSLVEQILAAHPEIHGAGERSEVQQICQMVSDAHTGPVRVAGCITDLTPAYLDNLAQVYLERVAGEAPDAKRITDKMPQNFLFLGMIARMFPRARIIRCVRDPVDTGLSCYCQNFKDTLAWAASIQGIASYIRAERRLMAFWKEVLPLPILDVEYESMVADPQNQAQRIVDFVGVPWNDACLDFHASARMVNTASYAQARQPIYTSSVGRSSSYEAHLQALVQLREMGP